MTQKIKARFLDWIEYGDYDEYDFPAEPKQTICVGDEFYLIHVYSFTSGTYSIGQPFPGRTNMSGEDRVNGWLGCTDNVDRVADGKWVVEKVVKLTGHDNEWVEVMARQLA